ncbi:MAG: CARDB domain-containing protein [Thermoplasmata archaeon]
MKSLDARSTIALVIVSVLLVSSIFVPLISAQNPQNGNVSLVVMYKDTQTGEVDFLQGLTVNILDYSGNIISSTVSNPVVNFGNLQVGNYIVSVLPQKIGSYVYSGAFIPITVSTYGSNVSTITVLRTAINKTVSIVVENSGVPASGYQVSAFYYYNLQFFSGITGSVGNITFNAPSGNFILQLTTTSGGAVKNYYIQINAPFNGTIDLSTFKHIFGIVKDSSDGSIIYNTIYVNIFNGSKLWNTLTFNNGVFNFYIYGTYKIVLTANGYSIQNLQLNGTYPQTIFLNKVKNYYNFNYSFSNDFKYIYTNFSFSLNNKTIFKALPYSDTNILYYQMLLNGFNSSFLNEFFFNSIRNYSGAYIYIPNYIYALKNINVTPFSIDYNGFTVNISAVYYNSSVNVSKLLSSGYIQVYVNVLQNSAYGAYNIYNYSVSIPEQYELSNNVIGATTSGYIKTIKITNATVGQVELDLKQRQKPQIILAQNTFGIYWNKMLPGNYIVNSSVSNFTILVKANTQVYLNASQAVKDMVRQQYSWTQMYFVWNVDGVIKQGLGLANVSENLTPGIHSLNLTVTDVGNNTNYTNIKIYSDGAYPDFSSNIKYSIGPNNIVSWNVYYENSTMIYNYEGNTSKISLHGYKQIVGPVTVLENNQITLYAFNLKDTLNGVLNSHENVNVIWDINGSKYIGNYVNYTFTYPTRVGYDWINVTYSDQVGNNFTISLMVYVKDTVKPVPSFVFQNKNYTTVTQIFQNNLVILNGTGSYDPQNGKIVSYSWTILNSTGAKQYPNSTYLIVSGNLNESVVTLKFTQYGTYYIILNVTDDSGNYNTLNKSLRVSPVAPDLVLVNFTWSGNFTEGTPTTFYVNATNTGNAPANIYYLQFYVNGKLEGNVSYSNLSVNKTLTLKYVWTPPSSGDYTIKFALYSPEEPKIFLGDNQQSRVVSVQEAAWKLPAIILGTIAVIVIVAFVIWRIRTKGSKKFEKKSKTEEKGTKSKTEEKGTLLHKK